MLGDLNKLKVVELKAELANRGLDTKGVKAVLVDRLKAALEEEGGGGSVSNVVQGGEEPKSSQESNDETEDVPSTPSRRGRRTTSTRDSEDEHVVEPTPIVPPTIVEERTPSPLQEAVSSAPVEPVETQAEETPPPEQTRQSELLPQAEQTPQPEPQEELQSHQPSDDAVNTADDGVCLDISEHEAAETNQLQPQEGPVVHEPQSLSSVSEETPQPVVSAELAPEASSSVTELGGNAEEISMVTSEDHEEPISESIPNDVDVKDEPPDVQQVKVELDAEGDTDDPVKDEPIESSRRARKSRFTDNDDAAQSGGEVKEEPMDTDGSAGNFDPLLVKSESSNDRKRRRSSSRSPRRSRSPPPRRQEDEPEIDESAVLLSWYDSDLNLIINKNDFLSATPMHQQGFGYVWAGARASFGFLKGKVCFEAKSEGHCDVSHLEADEPNPHVLRIGWSALGTSMQLGEEQMSYGYGGTGKSSVNCQFKDYGKPFGIGDTVTAYLDMDSEPKILSYAVNGEIQGVAYEISSSLLEGKALFPHFLSKNIKFSVNFNNEPSYPITEGYTLCGQVALEDRVPGPKRPEKKEDCEMIMMCGLPGCGKTTWANKHAAENLDQMYNILGTNNLIDKMKIMGLARKRNYSGRWEVLIDKCTKCLTKLFEVAGCRRRNYILDQTNVYPSAVRRKMRAFDGFKRKAVVIVPTDEEFQSRIAKREEEEGKDVPDSAVLEMKANFKVPEVGDIFNEVMFVELAEEEARAVVDKYRDDAREKGYLPAAHAAKRFKSERPAASGDRRHDDRQGSRDGREYREKRDHRDNRDNRDHRDRDRGMSFRPRGGPPNDRSRSGWQPRGAYGGHGGHSGGWRDRNDGYRGRSDSRGSWRGGSGGGRGGMSGGYDRHRGGGFSQSRNNYNNGRAGGSKGWGYNQGSGGSSWGSWGQHAQPEYSQQWQGQGQGQTAYSSSSWKGYGQQQQSSQQQTGYSQPSGYSSQGYSSYGGGSNANAYNWNQQYYQNYNNWGQQQTGAASGATSTGTPSSAVTSATSAAYDPYGSWNQYSSYGYSTSQGSAAAGATGSHSSK